MRISALARRTGVSAHRLRHYEALGLIRAERGGSNYREFADATVREVTFIAMGRELGFSLPELAEPLPRYRAGTLRIDEMIERLQSRIADVDAVITAQRALRTRLVEHIAWFRARQRKQARRAAQATPRFPNARRSSR